MNSVMRVLIALLFVGILVCVFKLISREKLLLKYSLLWIALCVLGLICDLFPILVYWASDLIGFDTPSNFIFLVAIALLLAITLSLSVAASRAVIANKNLTQRVALLEKELEDACRRR